MVSTNKTVNELYIEYYGRESAEKIDQVDVVKVIRNDGDATIAEVFKEYLPEMEANTGDEALIVTIKTTDGSAAGCIAKGKWLLFLVITVCLTVAILIFGKETVIEILQVIGSLY